MPRRDDIHKILIIGSGPIVIGQACEFDYSGCQACKVLRADGFHVVVINSNPATIMTDPEMADATYVEPIVPDVVAAVIAREKPDALLPTVGGQTGLNVAEELAERGVLAEHGVEMIGASPEAISRAESREEFRQTIHDLGLRVAASGIARTTDQAESIREEIGLPLIIRPSFTLGGTGGGAAYNVEEFRELVQRGLDASPTTQVLIEQSVIGWKEYELEVMRDKMDNVVIICSIENVDPMGIHTGDSITVAPAQTLTDREYQAMRDAAIAIIRGIGVETGGSNIQFAVNPADGEMLVIEMNPRVSRSSALASKATGFPIAKIAAKLAVGYTLDEIRNDITRETPACFEPTIDYCVTKAPRFTFEKFAGARPVLTTSMQSVGEAMAIGRTFKESLQKALRSLDIGVYGLDDIVPDLPPEELRSSLAVPGPQRVFAVKRAFQDGMTVDEVHRLSLIDPWFLDNILQLVELEDELKGAPELTPDLLRRAKEYGFSDVQLARLRDTTEREMRAMRKELGLAPVFKSVDTCAAEFEAFTPYFYSTYEQESEV
ncbi:MAG: carbamoyl-phosphate synthase large subunit [Planctomycetota bacterium]